MKKILSVLISLCLVTPAHAAALPYPDLDTYQDNFEAVYQMQLEGVFTGYPDGTFGGNLEINRAELTKVLVLGAGVPEDEVEACAAGAIKTFSDVPTEEWFTDYVYCAQARAWVQGDSGTDTFRPGDSVNVAEALKMIIEAQVGTPSTFASEQWYDSYFTYLMEMGYLEEQSPDLFYFTFTRDYLGSVDTLVNRANVAELLHLSDFSYELPFVSWVNSVEGMSLDQSEDTLIFENETPSFSLDVPLTSSSLADVRAYVLSPSGYDHEYMTSFDFAFYSEEEHSYSSIFSVDFYSPEYYLVAQENLFEDLLEMEGGTRVGVTCSQEVPDDLYALRSLICNGGDLLEALDFTEGL